MSIQKIQIIFKVILDLLRETKIQDIWSSNMLYFVISTPVTFLVLSLYRFRRIRSWISRFLCRIFLYTIPLTALSLALFFSVIFGIAFQDKITDHMPLYEYVNEDSEINALEKLIESEYGIRTYTNFDVNAVFHNEGISYELAVSNHDASMYLRELRYVLSQYSKEAIDALPRHMFLTTDLYHNNDDIDGVNCGNYIIFDAVEFEETEKSVKYDDHPYTIHHEFFHTLDELMDEDQQERFVKETESCELTSDYGCSNNSELLAEAWSRSVVYGIQNKHTEILQELYTKLLKGPEDGVSMVTRNDLGAGDDNDLVIKAVDYMISHGLTKIAVTDAGNLDEYALLKARSSFSRHACHDSINAYLYGQDLMIFIREEMLQEMAKDREYVRNLSDTVFEDNEDLSDYEMIEQIYRFVTKDLPDQELTDDRFRELLLSALLNENGFDAISDQYMVNIAYSDQHYWLIPRFEPEQSDVLYGFMMNDEYVSNFYEKIEPYYPECSDRSLSYFAVNGLYLYYYDEDAIVDYVLKVFRKGLSKAEMYIACEKEWLAKKVSDYLFDRDGKHSQIQRLYNRYCKPSGYDYYYPGSQANEYAYVIHIYNFE